MGICAHARAPTLLRSVDVAKHEIGPLITNTWPLILTFHFLFSSLSPYPSSFASLSPPLSLVNLPSITSSSPLFSLSISFSLHTLSIFYSNILNPTLHSLCLSAFFLHRPHYLFFFLATHTLMPMHTFPSFSKVLKSYTGILLIQMKDITVLQYKCSLTCWSINQILPPLSCIAFHSLSSCKIV